MAITDQTVRAAASMRATVDWTLDALAVELGGAWSRTWWDLAPVWEAALLDVVKAAQALGRWPARRTILRRPQITAAMASTRRALEGLTHDAGTALKADLPRTNDAVLHSLANVITTQLPSGASLPIEPVDQQELAQLEDGTLRRTNRLLSPVTATTIAGVSTTLARGVRLDQDPRPATESLLGRVHGAFNGGLNETLVVTRTELLDATRAATQLAERANAAVLAGWEWMCAADRRTCAACWAMDGRRFRSDQPGPEDHQQGRCTRVPVTLSWRELGFNVDEPPSTRLTARDVFEQLPQAERLAIMGPTRLRLLDSGLIGWDDLATKRSTPGWRDSWVPTPVKDLVTRNT